MVYLYPLADEGRYDERYYWPITAPIHIYICYYLEHRRIQICFVLQTCGKRTLSYASYEKRGNRPLSKSGGRAGHELFQFFHTPPFCSTTLFIFHRWPPVFPRAYDGSIPPSPSLQKDTKYEISATMRLWIFLITKYFSNFSFYKSRSQCTFGTEANCEINPHQSITII